MVWAIILFTILVKLVLSPITYKSFCLRQNESIEPEINGGENSKKTEETAGNNEAIIKPGESMAVASQVYTNARLLCFVSVFPFSNRLRQEGFLWANDLSSYDSIYELPFHIPFYGNHISCFRFWHRLQFSFI
jgi:YidC/Oxa1 family membrane protein insertase